MLCSNCHENEATVRQTRVSEGVVQDLQLCEVCAAAGPVEPGPPMTIDALAQSLGMEAPAGARGGEPSCPDCHMRWSDFQESGRMGCAACYEAFAGELPALLDELHQSRQHAGKAPRVDRARMRVKNLVDHIEGKLRRAVAAELFHEAARLRDELKRERARLRQLTEGSFL